MTPKAKAPKKTAVKDSAPAKTKAKAPKKEVKPLEKEPKKADTRRTLTPESIFAPYIGATISTDRMQPKKTNMIYVEIENELEEIETHLVDMNQCPQDIIDTWKGELV